MNVEIDTVAKALYLHLAKGRVADTIELAHAVVADVDKSGTVLGIEFVHVEDFASFVAAHPELVVLPPQLTYTSVDRGKTWQVEVGNGDRGIATASHERIAEMNGNFVADIIARPELVDQIVEGETITLNVAARG